MVDKISYAKTVYGEGEISAVVQCLRDSTQMGERSRKFESLIAQLFCKKECLYVNSGSSALQIGVEAFNFPVGGEIITPALTFGTTLSCILKNGLIPAFVDVEPLTYCIDASKIENMINEKTVGILAPDLLGNICDWPTIRQIANKYNLKVLHDSADTLGAELAGDPVGIHSDMSITSFYGSHIINCAGNGGALCLNDPEVIERAKLLRSWGRSSSLFDENSEKIENRFDIALDGIEYDAKFVFATPGYNVEGSEIGAAFGLVQLDSLDQNIEVRIQNYNRQIEYFSQYTSLFENPVQNKRSRSGFLAFPILIKEQAPFSRKQFQIYLEERDIQTRVCFTGNVLRQPMAQNIEKRIDVAGYPNSDAVMARSVLLPLHHGMTENMFNRLHTTIDEFIANHR
jgi:CDP-4-dehydro-6-deoxyglucose reductase, E1